MAEASSWPVFRLPLPCHNSAVIIYSIPITAVMCIQLFWEETVQCGTATVTGSTFKGTNFHPHNDTFHLCFCACLSLVFLLSITPNIRNHRLVLIGHPSLPNLCLWQIIWPPNLFSWSPVFRLAHIQTLSVPNHCHPTWPDLPGPQEKLLNFCSSNFI